MTTPQDPLDGIALPYSVVFVPTVGSYNPLIPPEMQNGATAVRLALRPGVSIVQVAWDGAETLRFNHWHDGGTPEILRIPSDTAGVQRTAVVTVAYEKSHAISCTTGTPTEDDETILSGRRVAVTVIPFATPTGDL